MDHNTIIGILAVIVIFAGLAIGLLAEHRRVERAKAEQAKRDAFSDDVDAYIRHLNR